MHSPMSRYETHGLQRRPSRQDYIVHLSALERQELRRHVMGNVTTFCASEKAHPLYFFEQVISVCILPIYSDVRLAYPYPRVESLQARRCFYCGRHLFVIERQCTCRDGELIHNDVLPDEMLDLLTQRGGISKESRAMNELGRMCTLALQAGTTRYAVVPFDC